VTRLRYSRTAAWTFTVFYVVVAAVSLSIGVFALPAIGAGYSFGASLIWAVIAGFLAAGVMRFLRKSGRLYRHD
jgi:amino acid transporter